VSTDTWLLILGAVAAVAGVAAAVGGIGAWIVTHRGNQATARAELRDTTRHAVDWHDESGLTDAGLRIRNRGPDAAHEVTVTTTWHGRTERLTVDRVEPDEVLEVTITGRMTHAKTEEFVRQARMQAYARSRAKSDAEFEKYLDEHHGNGRGLTFGMGEPLTRGMWDMHQRERGRTPSGDVSDEVRRKAVRTVDVHFAWRSPQGRWYDEGWTHQD